MASINKNCRWSLLLLLLCWSCGGKFFFCRSLCRVHGSYFRMADIRKWWSSHIAYCSLRHRIQNLCYYRNWPMWMLCAVQCVEKKKKKSNCHIAQSTSSYVISDSDKRTAWIPIFILLRRAIQGITSIKVPFGLFFITFFFASDMDLVISILRQLIALLNHTFID